MNESKNNNNPKKPKDLDLNLCKQIMGLYPYSKLTYLEKITAITKKDKNGRSN